MALGVGVGEEPGLEDGVGGGLEAGDCMGGCEGGLLNFGEIVVWLVKVSANRVVELKRMRTYILIQRDLAEFPKRVVGLWPRLCKVKHIPAVFGCICGVHDLH